MHQYGKPLRRLVVEAAFDAVALFLVIGFFYLVSVPQPFPWGEESTPRLAFRGAGPIAFLWFAVVLVLVNRFARPVIVALTGRLVLSTLGLFAVVINIIAFWLTTLVSPDIVTVAQPVIVWIVAAATAFTALSTVVDALPGLDRPAIDAEGRGQLIWRALDALPTPRRNAVIKSLRPRQVDSRIYVNSLDVALGRTGICAVRRLFSAKVLGLPVPAESATGPERMPITLRQIGPTCDRRGPAHRHCDRHDDPPAARARAVPEHRLLRDGRLRIDPRPELRGPRPDAAIGILGGLAMRTCAPSPMARIESR